MDEKKKIIDKINNDIQRINCMKKGEKRNIEIKKIMSYMSYQYQIGNIENSDYTYYVTRININKFFTIIQRDNKIIIKNLVDNNKLFINKYIEIINVYSNYDLDYTDNYIDYHNISLAMMDFFKNIKVFDLYKHLIDNNMIGRSVRLNKKDITIDTYGDSYIIIGNIHLNNMFYYNLFVHEMGHVYVHNILKNKRICKDLEISCEFVSVLFERLFTIFLKENSYLNLEELKKYIMNVEAKTMYSLNWAYLSNEIVKDKKYNKITNRGIIITDNNVFSLYKNCYVIGNFISIYLLNQYNYDYLKIMNDLPNIIKSVYKMDIKELFDNYFRIDYIKEYLDFVLDNQKIKVKS